MFSVDPTDASIGWLDSDHVIGKQLQVTNNSGRRTRKSKQGDNHGKLVVVEGLEVGL
jgi:hypothetical protein